MKRIVFAMLIISTFPKPILGDQFSALSGGATNCLPSYTGVETDSDCTNPYLYLTITKTINYSISWPDGHTAGLTVAEIGGCGDTGVCCSPIIRMLASI